MRANLWVQGCQARKPGPWAGRGTCRSQGGSRPCSKPTAGTPRRALQPPAAPALILTVILKVKSSGLGCLGSPKLFHVQPSCPHCSRAQLEGPLGRAGREPRGTGLEASVPGGRIPMHLPRRPQRDPPAQQLSHAPNTGQWHLHRGPRCVCIPTPEGELHASGPPLAHSRHSVSTLDEGGRPRWLGRPRGRSG